MLRALVGFEQCKRNTVDTWMATSGFAVSRYAGEPTFGKGLIVDDNGKLTTPAGTASQRTMAHLDFTPFMATAGANTIVIGFRYRCETAGFNTSDAAIYPDNGQGQTSISLCTFAQMGMVAGGDYYCELVLDLAASTWALSWNNSATPYYTGSLNSTFVTAFKAGNVHLLWNLSGAGTAAVMSLRDIYALDDIPGDGFIKKLGPRRIIPVNVDDVTGEGWTSSSAQSLLGTLNTQLETANPGLAVSPSGTGAQLNASLACDVPAGYIVEAISLVGAAQGSSASTQMTVGMKNGSDKSLEKVVALNTTLKYGLPLGVFKTAPNGAKWTKDNINSTAVTVTPDL